MRKGINYSLIFIVVCFSCLIGVWNTRIASPPESNSEGNIKRASIPSVPPPTAGLPPKRTSRPTKHHPNRNPASVNEASDDELIEQSLSKLKPGNLAYATPQKMKTGETEAITARIGSDAVPLTSLTQGMQGTGNTVINMMTPTSVKMKMTLKSNDFDVTPLNSEEQVVAGEIPTSWQWNVTPKHAGKLHLHLDAIVEVRNTARDFTTVDRDITVQVDPVDAIQKFIGKNWQWILSTIAAGIALAWKFFGPKKAKTTDTATVRA